MLGSETMNAITSEETGTSPRTRYDSPRMAERRVRILKFAHQILAEGGVEAMTINRLSELAEVAPSTIYRGFESKEGVIYQSIVEHMDGIADHLDGVGRPATFDAVEAEYDWIVTELHRDPEYARAIMQLYFSPTIDARARLSMRSVAIGRVEHFLGAMQDAGQLDPRIDPAIACERQVDLEYSVFLNWMQRSLKDESVADALKSAFFLAVAPILAEPARTEALERADAAAKRVAATEAD